MKEVKISYNQQTWNPETGTYYRGTFTLTEEVLQQFKEYLQRKSEQLLKPINGVIAGDKSYTGTYAKNPLKRFDDNVFINLTQRDYLIGFLQNKNIKVNVDRAYGAGNYYIKIKN